MKKELVIKRAQLKSQVREILDLSGLIEVDVPLLGVEACPDPSSMPIEIEYQKRSLFLQPSPEYFIKRLIAQRPGNYYSLAPCFRDDPVTKRHNPEFMMLEYYMMGHCFDEIQKLTQKIINVFIPSRQVQFLSYDQVFKKHAQLSLKDSIASYHDVLNSHQVPFEIHWEKPILEDLIFGTICQPNLGKDVITFVNDFPYHHRALAHYSKEQDKAYRFEAFIEGTEVANGYQECICANENKQRIQSWQNKWLEKKLKPPPSDKFLEASVKLKPCSGVAMGFDRMVLLSTHEKSLSNVLTFPWNDL